MTKRFADTRLNTVPILISFEHNKKYVQRRTNIFINYNNPVQNMKKDYEFSMNFYCYKKTFKHYIT